MLRADTQEAYRRCALRQGVEPLRPNMEQTFATACCRWGAFFPLAFAVFVLTAGCSSAAKCSPSQCAAGSECIDDGSRSGPGCHQVCTQQAACPFNWYCNDGQPKSWCVPNTIALTRRAGQWGESCLPSAGDVANPACDTADGFACYGTSPTDANAFCTMVDRCANDSDCPGGWWCATVDVAPNVTTAKRSFGPVHNVCLPRSYCAPCHMDHDCPLAADKTQQHCVSDSQGNGFCSSQCATNSNCPLDATCQALRWGVCVQNACKGDADCQAFAFPERCVGGECQVLCSTDADCPGSSSGAKRAKHCGAGGTCVSQGCASDDDCPPAGGIFQHCNAGSCTPECGSTPDCNPATGDQTCVPLSVCMPRAGVCVGDGTFCAPCASDADCSTGFCVAAAYSTERFCSQAMNGATCTNAGPPPGSCPHPPTGSTAKGVTCTTPSDDFAPANFCIGAVTFGTAMGAVQYAPGCWTVNR